MGVENFDDSEWRGGRWGGLGEINTSATAARLDREIKFPPRLVVPRATPEATRLLHMALERVHPGIRPAAASVKRPIGVPTGEVPGVPAGEAKGVGHAATDDAGQMGGLVLHLMAVQVPLALLQWDVAAYVTFHLWFDLGVGGARGGQGVRIRGRRIDVSGCAFGLQCFRRRIYGPKCPALSRTRRGRNVLRCGRQRHVVVGLDWKRRKTEAL